MNSLAALDDDLRHLLREYSCQTPSFFLMAGKPGQGTGDLLILLRKACLLENE
jgi:hypothetical protein